MRSALTEVAIACAISIAVLCLLFVAIAVNQPGPVDWTWVLKTCGLVVIGVPPLVVAYKSLLALIHLIAPKKVAFSLLRERGVPPPDLPPAIQREQRHDDQQERLPRTRD